MLWPIHVPKWGMCRVAVVTTLVMIQLSSRSAAGAEWEVMRPDCVPEDLTAVAAPVQIGDEGGAIAVGEAGVAVAFREDGWCRRESTGTRERLEDLWCSQAGECFAVGAPAATVLHRSAAGEWTRRDLPISAGSYELSAVWGRESFGGSPTVFVATKAGRIYASTGTTWSQEYAMPSGGFPPGSFLFTAIDGPDARGEVFAATYYHGLLFRRDWGGTWERVSQADVDSSDQVTDFWINGSGTKAVFVTNRGEIHLGRWTSGTASTQWRWSRFHATNAAGSEIAPPWSAISELEDGRLLLVATDKTAVLGELPTGADDDGTWTELETVPGALSRALRDASGATVVGDGGTMARARTEEPWAVLHAPSPNLNDLSSIWYSFGFAVGDDGVILRLDEDGVLVEDEFDWHGSGFPVPPDLNGVWVFSTRDTVAVGTAGAILRRARWNPPESSFSTSREVWHVDPGSLVSGGGGPVPLTPHDLHAVSGSSSCDAFAVGDAGTILHNDGRIWEVEDSTTDLDLFAVTSGPPIEDTGSTTYAVGQNGLILQRSSSSGIWEPVRAAAEEAPDLQAVLAVPDGPLYAVGPSTWLVSDDGTRWDAMEVPVESGGFRDIWASSLDAIYLAGQSDGRIWFYDGSELRETLTEAGVRISALSASHNGNVLAVGEHGTVLRFTGIPLGETAPPDPPEEETFDATCWESSGGLIRTIVSRGSDCAAREDRMDIVFFNADFSAEEESEYNAQVLQTIDALLATEPFSTYRDLLNFHLVWLDPDSPEDDLRPFYMDRFLLPNIKMLQDILPVESGFDVAVVLVDGCGEPHPWYEGGVCGTVTCGGAAGLHPEILQRRCFGDGTDHCLRGTGSDEDLAHQIFRAAYPDLPEDAWAFDWDGLLRISAVRTALTCPTAPDNPGSCWVGTAVHEIAHSVGALEDEYDSGALPLASEADCPEMRVRFDLLEYYPPNVMLLDAAGAARRHNYAWADLITAVSLGVDAEDPPAGEPGPVGGFQGAVYETRNRFRPRSDCMMRTTRASTEDGSAVSLCPVCQRQLADQIRRFGRYRPSDTGRIRVQPRLSSPDTPYAVCQYGGTVLDIIGEEGFADPARGANEVLFGGFPAPLVQVIDDARIRVMTPSRWWPWSPSASPDIEVRNRNGVTVVTDGFSVLSNPPVFRDLEIEVLVGEREEFTLPEAELGTCRRPVYEVDWSNSSCSSSWNYVFDLPSTSVRPEGTGTCTLVYSYTDGLDSENVTVRITAVRSRLPFLDRTDPKLISIAVGILVALLVLLGLIARNAQKRRHGR